MKCILLSKVLLRNKPIKKILNNNEDNHKKRGPTPSMNIEIDKSTPKPKNPMTINLDVIFFKHIYIILDVRFRQFIFLLSSRILLMNLMNIMIG